MEKEPNSHINEKEKLSALADELDNIQLKKSGGRGDIIMQKLIQRLRDGDAYSAKVFCANESDKFSPYREDVIPLLIDKLYNGSGSPWFTVERKLRKK